MFFQLIEMFYSVFLYFIFIVDTIRNVPISPPSPTSPLPSGHHHTVVCDYESIITWLEPAGTTFVVLSFGDMQ